MTKTIKISKDIHKELKLYVAGKEGEVTITEFADKAIREQLTKSGHTFPKKNLHNSKK